MLRKIIAMTLANILLFSNLTAFNTKNETIAVFDFIGNDINSNTARTLSDRLRIELVKYNFINVLEQSIKPSRFLVMINKIRRRFFINEWTLTQDQNLKWIKENVTEVSNFAKTISPHLWEEAKTQSKIIEQNANKTLENIPYNLGGGADYPLLYFLTRYLSPGNVLETGVAAGFSSYAILSALQKNGKGTLYSSDFPYFRI